ncbi:MAG TPA: NAD(P)H-dependent oxidoreductase [Opitutaceae bacterium]
MPTNVTVREEQPSVQLTKEQFVGRWRERLADPRFSDVAAASDAVIETAWDAYLHGPKSPRKVKAGPEFAHPDAELAEEWLETRQRIHEAKTHHDDPDAPLGILLISGSMRSNQTCPGETSKTYRLARLAQAVFDREADVHVDFLDLSLLTAEYGRIIHPCKACASTAMPLCHWPCSCYPNFAMGQVNDWMAELYPRWVAAHGILIVTPVNWYHVPAGLKAMMDRLVCADGGNPDPTLTDGKDPAKAKALELAGWHYPRHLEGRTFGVVAHGDAAGAETLRRSLTDWASDMRLLPVEGAQLDRMIGYLGSYARSHEALDADTALQEEVRNVARALLLRTREVRLGRIRRADTQLTEPRPK